MDQHAGGVGGVKADIGFRKKKKKDWEQEWWCLVQHWAFETDYWKILQSAIPYKTTGALYRDVCLSGWTVCAGPKQHRGGEETSEIVFSLNITSPLSNKCIPAVFKWNSRELARMQAALEARKSVQNWDKPSASMWSAGQLMYCRQNMKWDTKDKYHRGGGFMRTWSLY